MQSTYQVSNEEQDEIDLDIDKIINTLVQDSKPDGKVSLSLLECQSLALVAREELKNDPIILSLNAPIRVCGDIHGQFDDLIRLFKLAGFPPDKTFLFLGDYVDRGKRGLECMCLLLAYKIKYPTKVYLLRGNHETEVVSRIYGFRDEIIDKFQTSKLWWTFLRTFNYLPLAAIIENSVFCCHGGISPEFLHKNFRNLITDMNKLPRPYEVPLKGLICDLLWADPLDQIGNKIPSGFVPNERGCSWSFGFDVVDKFLEKFDLDLVVRAHQVVEDGYEFYANRKVLTVFSAPNYCGEFDNAGGIFCLENNTRDGKDETIDGAFLILKPDITKSNLIRKTLGFGRRTTKVKK